MLPALPSSRVRRRRLEARAARGSTSWRCYGSRMPTERICDTNVFYDLSSGRITAAAIKRDGARVLASPVAILEIISHLTPENFQVRQGAAAAILDHADGFLPDPETYLADVWGVAALEPPFPWEEALRALRGARRIDDLTEGVPDFQQRVVRRVDFALAQRWRDGHYEDFVRQMEAFVGSLVPGYVEQRAVGRLARLNREERAPLAAGIRSQQALFKVLEATKARAYLVAEMRNPPRPTLNETERVLPFLICYITVYAKYAEKLATQQFAADINDWGDLESFVFLRDGRQVVTSERRWLRLAEELELGDLVATPATL